MAYPKIYCITNIQSEKLEKLSVNLVGVGKNSFNSNYIKCEGGENINFKELKKISVKSCTKIHS